MSAQRQRVLLFLGGCILIGVGTSFMVFGDTHVASSVGGTLAGMGMVINLIQLLFKLPLEFSRRNTAQESNLLLPPSYPRKKSQHIRELILPVSYDHMLQRRQQARRSRILEVATILMLFVPLLGLATYPRVFPPSGSCILLTKQIAALQYNGGKYELNMTAQMKDGLFKSPEKAYYGGPYDTLQEAQKIESHFLVGLSYPCHLVVPAAQTPLPPILYLDSDIPLSK